MARENLSCDEDMMQKSIGSHDCDHDCDDNHNHGRYQLVHFCHTSVLFDQSVFWRSAAIPLTCLTAFWIFQTIVLFWVFHPDLATTASGFAVAFLGAVTAHIATNQERVETQLFATKFLMLGTLAYSLILLWHDWLILCQLAFTLCWGRLPTA